MAAERTTASEVIAADWMSPSQAVQVFDATFGASRHSSQNALLECLRGKQVLSITAQTTFHPDNGPRSGDVFYAIPPEDWERIEWNDAFWNTGILTYRRRKNNRSTEYETVRHFNVRFRKKDVLTIVAPHQKERQPNPVLAEVDPPPEAPAEGAQKNKGGAPRKEWWDDFWIAICRRIWEGDLKPTSQAELERAMLDWASENGHSMSETGAKVVARKLWRAWNLGGKI